jgi:hypothetical protein
MIGRERPGPTRLARNTEESGYSWSEWDMGHAHASADTRGAPGPAETSTALTECLLKDML